MGMHPRMHPHRHHATSSTLLPVKLYLVIYTCIVGLHLGNSTIQIGVNGDWTVEKVGSMLPSSVSNTFSGRNHSTMCNLTDPTSGSGHSKLRVHTDFYHDTSKEEDVIFHKAAKLVPQNVNLTNDTLHHDHHPHHHHIIHTKVEIDVFWHMGAIINAVRHEKGGEKVVEGGSEGNFHRIVSRQHALLRSSGLWQAAYGIHIGVIGNAELPKELIFDINISPHVEIFARVPSGDESVTTTYMRELCRLRHHYWSTKPQEQQDSHHRMVVYFHSRGISHEIDHPTNYWTLAMEYFIIENWRSSSAIISAGADTAGMAKEFNSCRLHYSGNFFWASVDYIAGLPDPNILLYGVGGHYLGAGEMWLLAQDPNPKEHVHFKLHNPTAGAKWSLYSFFNHYGIPYLESYYKCNDVEEPNMPSRIPCNGMHFKSLY